MLKRSVFFLLLAGILSSLTPALAADRFWSFYLMGTNYERTQGAISQYLDTMVAAYESLEDQDRLQALIAFGGVNKEGWRGVRFVDLPTLTLDSKDGVYGNLEEKQYVYMDNQADMGAQSTLSTFLDFANDRIGDSSLSLFTMFDHGASYYPRYAGIGPDDWTDSCLDLGAIRSSLAETGSHFDMISFDACLMGSLEAARSVAGYADYMMASEEVMYVDPTLMWDEVLKNLATAPDIVTYGKNMVDLATGVTPYPLGSHPTRSFVDLRQAERFSLSVDQLGRAMSVGMHIPRYASEITLAGGMAQRFSPNFWRGDTHWISNDLYDMASLVSALTSSSQVKKAAGRMLDSFDRFVVYSRNDGSHPDAHGISQAPLGMVSKWASYHADRGWLTQGWNQAVQSYNTLAELPSARPELGDVVINAAVNRLGRVVAGTGNGDLPDSGYAALAARLDAEYPSGVQAGFGVMDPDGSFNLFQSQEAFLTDRGWVFTPEWDGDWLSVYDASAEEYIALPMLLSYVDEGKAEYYYAYGELTRASGESSPAYLDITHDLVSGGFSHNLLMVDEASDGSYRLFGQPTLTAGDAFVFNSSKLTPGSESISHGVYRSIGFEGAPDFRMLHPDTISEVLYVKNVQGKVGWAAAR